MGKFTAKQLEEKIEEYIEEDSNNWGDGWYSLEWGEAPTLPDQFGKVEFVESFGGEGMGDVTWIVFKVGDRYFQKTGSYDSWNGTDWEYGTLKEVEQVEVTVKQWHDLKEVK
jgi:hypothetical protein